MAELVADSNYISPPVQRAARLLRRIADGDGVTNMSRTAAAIGINRTTLLRLLHTLEAEGLIERAGDEAGWRIGLGLVAIAARSFFSGDLIQTATPVLARLAEQLGLSTHLGVLDRREIVFVVRRTPNHSFASNIHVGSRLPAHAGNMGRIILAHLPAERVEKLYKDVTLEAATAHTPTSFAGLRARLDQDLRLGLAWSDGHFEPGISSVAAAIFDASGAPVAAMNVSGQTVQFGGAARRREIAAATQKAATEISQRLGWGGPTAQPADVTSKPKSAKPPRGRKRVGAAA
jgi:DNA-binding IclR family transcriptional regulator